MNTLMLLWRRLMVWRRRTEPWENTRDAARFKPQKETP